MWKSLCLAVILFVCSLLLITEAAFSRPVIQLAQSPEPVKIESPEASNPKVDMPDCQGKTTDSKNAELDKACEKATEISKPRHTYRKPPESYNMNRMKRFDDRLYGDEN